MALIEIDERTAAALRALANARNVSLDSLLQSLARDTVPVGDSAWIKPEDFERSLDEASGDSPVLPDAFSREDLYSDHD